MKIVPIASALGADVVDLDLPQPMSAAQRDQLIQAWRSHLVLRVRGQSLNPEGLIGFSRNFGELERHDNYLPEVRHEDHPEVLLIKSTNVKGEQVVFGQQWHADLTYTLHPAKGACLYCVKLPPAGGDTLFSNMYLAYETLSPAMRTIVDRLEAVHDLTHGNSYRHKTLEQIEQARRRNPAVIQPLVRVHPHTGRKALCVSEWMCRRIVGMSEDESHGILRFLFDHSTRPEFTFRQTWQIGDVLLWDNYATIHMALKDYAPGAPRELLRTSIAGVACGRLATSSEV
jgi:taurine dioxygenase